MTRWRWLAISPEIELTLSLDSDEPELIERVESSAKANGIVLERIAEPVRQWSDGEIAAIEDCPTPSYHLTHRYCPSCPWTEEYVEAGTEDPAQPPTRAEASEPR